MTTSILDTIKSVPADKPEKVLVHMRQVKLADGTVLRQKSTMTCLKHTVTLGDDDAEDVFVVTSIDHEGKEGAQEHHMNLAHALLAMEWREVHGWHEASPVTVAAVDTWLASLSK